MHFIFSQTHDENRLLMALVRLPTPVPGQDFNPRPDLVFFLRQIFISEDQPVILALDGSCLVFAKQELYQKASWAVIAPDTDTFDGRVEGAHQTPAAVEGGKLFCKPCLLPTMLVRLLIDNQVVVSRLGVEKWNFGVLLPEHFPTKKDRLAAGP